MKKNINSLSFLCRHYLLHLIFISLAILFFGCENKIEKANALIETGAFDQAFSLLDKEIQNNPKNKKAHLAMANCLATKHVDIKIKGIKDERPFVGDSLKPSKKALKRKAIDYYQSALQLDPNYIDALFNLSDFYIFINQSKEAKAGFEKVIRLDGNNTGAFMPLMMLSQAKTTEEKLKHYFNNISKNEAFEIIPQKNMGTVIIGCNDCEALLKGEGEKDTKINLKKYDVYKQSKINGDIVEFYYDTIEKLNDKEEYFYKLTLIENVKWNTGPRDELYKPKKLNYYDRLYERTLTEKEKKVLWETPWFNGAGTACTNCNVMMLFTGDYYYSDKRLNKHPEYKLSNQIPYVDKKDYRKIEPIGKTISYDVKYLGSGYLRKKYGKIVAQKVKAQKYLMSVDRFVQINSDNVIFGAGNIEIDN